METEKLRYGGRDRIKSIGRALDLLNDAAADSASELRRMVRKDYHELADVLGDMGEEAAGHIRDTAEDVTQSTREAVTRLDERAHENPWSFVGGTAVLAGLLGYVLGRRRVH